MSHVAGFERDQLLLLPEAVDDYVGSDNRVASSMPSLTDWTSDRRGPDLADRSRQPRHGRAYQGRRRLQRSSGGRREEQADRRTGGDKPDRGHGLADGNFRAGPRNPGGRDDRRRSGRRLLQDRRHRGLREGRLHSSHPQAATRLLGARGPVSQGRVPIRCRARRLRLPGREVSDADPPGPAARSRKDRLRQPESLPRLPLRPRCTNDARSVFRLENEDVLERMAERLKARPAILDRRREVVEHPFGSIKQWMYQGAFLMRGLANVRAEFSLTTLAYNLRRALNILGVEAMTAAVAA